MTTLAELQAQYDTLNVELGSLHEVLDAKTAERDELREKYYAAEKTVMQICEVIFDKGSQLEALDSKIKEIALTGGDTWET